ncbi:hypothetical protein [Glaciimonas immobilis]|uniref:Uncharacterized protein n=1 Tax=Glaciimonas immobilis TaxID=728004 RepID=A0A840RX17_9BURK|nr:hypothetical protein [Glaciimonas immobilis]KAF3995968.1 hypothetical protein HAV38_20900 [Glaciimonas immobilis]MBB5202435.1 hypothetical protein [Glaciimonas immobilis]
MHGLRWKLDGDGKAATLFLPTDPPTAMRLTTAQIDEMVGVLGIFRATMEPSHTLEWPSGKKVVMEPFPRWFAERDALIGGTLLHLRDPRFGWLHYVFPPEAARELGQHLIAQADAPPQGPAESGAE